MIEIAEATYNVDIKKKSRFQALIWYYFNRKDHGKKLSSLFEVLNISKQSFHQMFKSQEI